MKFVFVTPDFRYEMSLKSEQEEDLIIKYGQPSYSFVNDKEDEFGIMDNTFYQSPTYKFNHHISTKTFSDLCYERACELRDMDKEIEVYDDTLVLQWLREVCPSDQILEFDINNPRPLTRLIVIPHHYNMLFTHLDKRWRDRIRYFLLTVGWDVLSNFGGDNFPIENFQPFYLHPNFESWANNLYIEKGPRLNNYFVETYKYELGNILAITSEGKCVYRRRKPVKENNINEYKKYICHDSS